MKLQEYISTALTFLCVLLNMPPIREIQNWILKTSRNRKHSFIHAKFLQSLSKINDHTLTWYKLNLGQLTYLMYQKPDWYHKSVDDAALEEMTCKRGLYVTRILTLKKSKDTMTEKEEKD